MLTWLIVAVVAASTTCTTAQVIKQRSPTHVPKRCFLDRAQGSCNDYTRQYYFNVTVGYCQPFVYGGCGGNWNRFTSPSECHKTCTCAIPPESGPCRGYIRRWFYSPEDGCCRPFVYGGCGGNKNSYASWTECSESCGYPTADSSWWTWGAQWGNLSAGQSTGQTSGTQMASRGYTRNDFMRDWMLWNMLSGGEGFEIENIATVIAQAHILGIGKSMGGTGTAGGSFGFGSQIFGQDGANGIGVALGNNRMQGSGMGNLGPAYQTRPGSFTPLGQLGSVANLMNGELSESMADANVAWNQLQAAGLVGGVHRAGAGVQSQGSSSQSNSAQSNWGFGGQNVNTGLEQRWIGSTGSGISGSMQDGMSMAGNVGTSGSMNTGISSSLGAEMSGQGSWRSQGIGQFKPSSGSLSGGTDRWVHGEGRWGTGVSGANNVFDIGSGALGYRGFGPAGSNPKEFGSAAIEILHLIGQIGRGALGPSDLINLGRRYGAVSQQGHVDVNLLATRLVTQLQGPRGEMNMARLKSVAQRLGALDSNGNINLPLLVKGISGTISSRDSSSNLGGLGLPSVDEFNWLGSRKGSLDLGTGGNGIGGSSQTQRGGVSKRRISMTGSGSGQGLLGQAEGGIAGAIRGMMGGGNGIGGGVSGMGGRGSGFGGGASGLRGGGSGFGGGARGMSGGASNMGGRGSGMGGGASGMGGRAGGMSGGASNMGGRGSGMGGGASGMGGRAGGMGGRGSVMGGRGSGMGGGASGMGGRGSGMGGGASGMGGRGSGMGGGASGMGGGAGAVGGLSGTMAVQTINAGGGSRRMGSYGRK